jgi:hypothetical protein
MQSAKGGRFRWLALAFSLVSLAALPIYGQQEDVHSDTAWVAIVVGEAVAIQVEAETASWTSLLPLDLTQEHAPLGRLALRVRALADYDVLVAARRVAGSLPTNWLSVRVAGIAGRYNTWAAADYTPLGPSGVLLLTGGYNIPTGTRAELEVALKVGSGELPVGEQVFEFLFTVIERDG